MSIVDIIPLHETARERYLNYALSVITSRALPDIRDGLKPVHRRIIYAMYTNLRLYPEGRFRKSAAVVGEVMGKYHPHGDTAIYDAMVRMAQSFSMRYPLVDGHGNFGSLDGDSPAAMRYTEAKLLPLAITMLEEIKKQTVEFRANFDGTVFEPVVLPASAPILLVNGASGIAVGMATNIPPHNLGEVIDALIYVIDSPNARVETLVKKYIKGPDFPTGGRILNVEDDLIQIYATGEGALELRGEYRMEGKKHIIIHSIPYGLTKATLIELIADHIMRDKVPQLIDIRDESTDDVRIVLELRRGATPDLAMAYLFKHTPLQSRFHVNMTCLVPTDNPEMGAPAKVDLITILRHFLAFRMKVVVRRLEFDLDQLEKRIHILQGFEKIFDGLDEAIRIIRSSENKRDSSQRLIHRFRLDEIQADAILETKLYKLSRLEIDGILAELADKEARAAELRLLLGDEPALWKLIRKELRALKKSFGDERRTNIAGPDQKLEYSEEDYILAENVSVIVTVDGWVKRQRSYTDLRSIRIREGDHVGWAIGASTRNMVCFMTTFGKVYTIRVEQLPGTTGHGIPIQKLFEFADREQIIGVMVFNKCILPKPVGEPDPTPELFTEQSEAENSGPYLVAVSQKGQAVRLPAANYSDASTKNGRLFMRLTAGDEVVCAQFAAGDENVCIATNEGNALIFPLYQVPVSKNAAKGVIAIRLTKKGRVIGATLSNAARRGLEVETNRGRKEIVRTTKFDVSNRGNKGKQIIQRGTLTRVVQGAVEIKLNGDD